MATEPPSMAPSCPTCTRYRQCRELVGRSLHHGLRTHRAESGGDESPASGSSSVEFRQRLHPESESAPRSVVQQKPIPIAGRSEEHTSELQSLMRNSYAVFCLKKKKKNTLTQT